MRDAAADPPHWRVQPARLPYLVVARSNGFRRLSTAAGPPWNGSRPAARGPQPTSSTRLLSERATTTSSGSRSNQPTTVSGQAARIAVAFDLWRGDGCGLQPRSRRQARGADLVVERAFLTTGRGPPPRMDRGPGTVMSPAVGAAVGSVRVSRSQSVVLQGHARACVRRLQGAASASTATALQVAWCARSAVARSVTTRSHNHEPRPRCA